MSSWGWGLVATGAALLACALAAAWWASGKVPPRRGERVVRAGSGPVGPSARPGDELVVVSWNIAFGGGPDGQPTDRHDAPSVRARLDGIARELVAGKADVVFLQEVDRPSDRSGGIDQFAFLVEAVGLPHACFVTTWDVRWLPHPAWPPSRHIGRVHSGQAILSRYPISSCERIDLPQPDEYPRWYRRFYLHRGIQIAAIDPGDGRQFSAINVHLEAFSQPNREAQAVLLRQVADSHPWRAVVAGDFNAVPADAVRKSGFPDEEIDFSSDTTLERFAQGSGFRECLLDGDVPRIEAREFSFPAREPTRRLDYVFHRGFGQVRSARVDREALVSDHLPVWCTLTFQAP